MAQPAKERTIHHLALATQGPPFPRLTPFHRRVLAEVLSARPRSGVERLTSALSESRLDLNPHQVEAAAFALDSIPRGGCLLADEVGLGKTIEAGLVLAQLIAEGKSRLLVIVPASLGAQWLFELEEKFGISARLLDSRSSRQLEISDANVLICSFQFAARNAGGLSAVPWDLVVIDEAHHLRNAHRPSHKTGAALRSALQGRPKLLLTATPLQNNLMELFGLVSFLDERILGPEPVFKDRYLASSGHQTGLDEDATKELKERLSDAVQRTLRRQVREYVRFTQRRSVVEDFTPSPEEARLYEKVSAYLQRSNAAAIDPSRRTLLTLVYRKLLASSSYAIAPTLRKLALKLRTGGTGGEAEKSAIGALDGDERAQDAEEAEAWGEPGGAGSGASSSEKEIRELEAFATAAESIRSNSKGEALVRALDRTFTVARAHRWPERAVIFTESKRTQAYLFELLSERGFRGKITRLSGDSGTAAQRHAAIQEFRLRTQILLSTDAGAEGLNLQFCNLVVNYDLPWNPQRIEQRIGRCHRYGQARDVLVINFLNRRNAADARLFELLERKLRLFDGVFGASDEILGALESGVDFERRILDIYQSCRSPEEINAAFDALRAELDRQIDERITHTRSLLFDRFDGDVRRRLRLLRTEAQHSIDQRRRCARALAGFEGEPPALHPAGGEISRAIEAGRSQAVPPVSFLSLDPTQLPPQLASLMGSEGWWLAYRVEVPGLCQQARVVQLILVKEKERFVALPLEAGEAFLNLPAREETQRKPAAVSFAHEHEAAWREMRERILKQAREEDQRQLDRARERMDRYTEDCLQPLRQASSEAWAEWQTFRRNLMQSEDEAERIRLRAQTGRLERDYRKRLGTLRAAEESSYGQKDRAMAQLIDQAQIKDSRALIASAYFWL